MHSFVAGLTRMFRLCQETHQRPFGEANSSDIAFEVPFALNYGGNLALHHVSIPNCVTCKKVKKGKNEKTRGLNWISMGGGEEIESDDS